MMKKIPLSRYQHHLWLEWKLNPIGTEYNTPLIYRIVGQLNIPVLQKALFILINQYYDAARGYVIENSAGPTQIILDNMEVHLEVQTLQYRETDKTLAYEHEYENERLEALINHTFDLSGPPLFKFTLLKIIKNEPEHEKSYILVLNFHHIISDAQTAVLLTKILSSTYHALMTLPEDDISHPVLLRSFSEAVSLQQQNYTERKQKIDLEYWQKKLQDKILHVDFSACPRQRTVEPQNSIHRDEHNASIIYFTLEKHLTSKLRNLAKEQGSTLFLILSAIFSGLLHRYTQQKSIILTYPINMRRAGLPVMGSFVNMIPSIVEFTTESTFLTLIKDLTENRKEAKAHQQITLSEVMKLLRRNRSITSLDFNVGMGEAFLFSSPLVLDGLQVTSMQPLRRRAFNDLYLYYEAKDNGTIECRFEYRTSVLTAYFMNRFTNTFVNMLEVAIEDPSAKIAQLTVLTEEEKQKIMQWGNQGMTFPLQAADLQSPTLHGLFELQVEKTPDQIAIQHLKQSMTYTELNRASSQLVEQIQNSIQHHHLKKESCRITKIIGICLPRGIEHCIGILGILKAGYSYLPLDTEDSSQRIVEMVQDANIDLFITNQLTSKRLASLLAVPILHLNKFSNLSLQNTIPTRVTSLNDNSLAYVMYTSGTTGKPKGVMVEHKSVINLVLDAIQVLQIPAAPSSDKHASAMAAKASVSEGSEIYASPYTILSLSSPTFDIHGLELYAALWTGGRHIICPDQIRQDPKKLAQCILDLKPTFIQATPTLWSLIIMGFQQLKDKNFLNSERILNFPCTFLSGGEALSHPLAEQLLKLVGPLGQVWNVYGPTETTIWSTYYRVKKSDIGLASDLTKALSLNSGDPLCIGKPFANTYLYVLDPYQQLVPVGVKGELYIGGMGLSPGYLNNPIETEKHFSEKCLTHPFFSSDAAMRLYKTGDLVHWTEEGNLVYLGREDEQVKMRGHRIELSAIEQIFKQHPQLSQVIVKFMEEKIVLFYTRKKQAFLQNVYKSLFRQYFAGSKSLQHGLKKLAKEQLSRVMQPTAFIELATLPLDSHGKLDHAALKSHFMTQQNIQQMNMTHPFLKGKDAWVDRNTNDYRPYDIIDLEIKRAWCKVLRVADVELDQNFMDAGGDSLSIVHLSLLLSDRFKKSYSVAWIHRYPTILKQAQFIRENSEIHSLYQPMVRLNCPIAATPNGDAIHAQDDARPLFLIHPALGGVEAYEGLARCLPHIPLYAFDSVNLNSGLPLKNSIEELAHYYIEHLRIVKPKGPYTLGGWSLGGMIAFEMAHILKRQNETIDQLYLIDTQIYRADYLQNTYDLCEMEDIIQQLPPDWANHFKNMPKKQLETVLQSFKQDICLLRKYVMKPWTGSVVLFKSTQKTNLSRGLINAQHNGWKPYVPDLKIIQIDCTHYDIIKGSAVQEIAQKIIAKYTQ